MRFSAESPFNNFRRTDPDTTGYVFNSALTGADVARIPYSVMLQLSKHPLTDAGIRKFLEDWQNVPK